MDSAPARRPPVRGPLNIDSWSDELSQGGYFARPEVTLIPWEHQLTPAGARRLFASVPNVNELAPAVRTAFLDAVAGLVEHAGGVVSDPHVTVLYVAGRGSVTKISDSGRLTQTQ